jgi:PP-loop superfamily ATP-utilizing enzyme
METIILHPKNKSQLSLLKKLAKEMGVTFETKKQVEEEETYNPEFVAKIMRSREDSENGRVTIIKTEDLWK